MVHGVFFSQRNLDVMSRDVVFDADRLSQRGRGAKFDR